MRNLKANDRISITVLFFFNNSAFKNCPKLEITQMPINRIGCDKHTHTHTHTQEYYATIKNASSITPQNKINISCKCSVDKRTLDRKWVHLDGLKKQMKHIYTIRSQVELILRRGLASDHRVCLRPQSILLGISWCPLSWTGCWIYRCAQLWKFIKTVLKIYTLFSMLCYTRKVNRKLKCSITVYSHSCAFGIRKIKCASWNIYHWKKHFFKKNL